MRKLLSIFKGQEKPAPATQLPGEHPPEEVALGQPSFSYEKLTGKDKSHYTDIILDPGHLPKVRLGVKPDNRDYLTIKRELVEQAYQGLRPYISFVSSLKGVAGRPDLHDALRAIMYRFLIRYWDMPASADHHHHYFWGFALHSLDVGCGEAEAAQSWTPMSDHGIDEIAQAQDLGMVVLLHFAKGLFHDAHKIYQYTMLWKNGAHTVRFDPIHHEGNILDFKLVYPTNRQEGWAPSIPHPGKLNSLEFLSIYPRELWSYAPQNMFFQVNADLFDLIPSQADKESARRDLSRAGRATLEDLIAGAVTAYFTTEKSKTNPANHVFRVSGSDWTAVNVAQFFLKIRPVSGGVYSADGVRSCLADLGVLAGSPGESAVSVQFLIRMPNGKEKTSDEKMKLAFIKTDYLVELFPALNEYVGEAVFLEKDRDLVTRFCPGASKFIKQLPSERAAPPAGAAALGESRELQHQSQQQPQQENSPTPEFSQKTYLTAEKHMKRTESLVEKDPPRAELDQYSDTDWEAKLFSLLATFSGKDCDPKTGWIFCDLERALVRIPQFYEVMTSPALLKQKGWGNVAEAMCRELAKNSLLDPTIIKGKVNFIAPGGADASTTGGFFALRLQDVQHNRIMAALYKSN